MIKKQAVLAALMIVVALGAAAGCGRTPEAVSDSAQETDGGTAVQVLRPEYGPAEAGTLYKATLEPAEEAVVSSQIAGKVVAVAFEEGQRVNQGTVLVRLDDRAARSQLQMAEAQLASSKAALQKIEAGLVETRTTYERIQALFSQGAASQSELDSARSALDMLEADAAAARAGVKASEGSVESCRITLDNCVVKAPISGVLSGKAVTLGQQVNPDLQLGWVREVSSVDAVFEVDQSAVEKITEGAAAAVKLHKEDSRSFSGTVRTVDLSADPSSRVFRVTVRLQNPEGLLRPGVMAWVGMEGEKAAEVMTLPLLAVLGKEGDYSVLVHEKGVAVRKAVQLGAVLGDRVVILSGLTGETEVIVTNLNTLQDGDPVTVAAE